MEFNINDFFRSKKGGLSKKELKQLKATILRKRMGAQEKL